MTTHVMHAHPYRSWQFSLRSLMFVTTIVAICAALVSISVVLSILLVPLIVAGLSRTIRIAARQEATGDAKPRLFATFCNSLLLVVATIAVGMATIVVAAMAGALGTLMVTIHVLGAARPIYRPIARRVWRLLVEVKRMGAMVVSRIEPVAILRWLQVHTAAGTLALVALSRRLLEQCWNGNGAGSRTSEFHAG